MLALNQTHAGHALELARQLTDNSIHTIITSPPFYKLRDYKTKPVYWPEVTFHPMPGLPPLTIPAQTCNLGLESDLWAYVGHLVALFRELRRALHPAGSLWLNLGDSYAGSGKGRKGDGTHQEGGKQGTNRGTIEGYLTKSPLSDLKPKDLMMIPARVALALQADGWYLRSDIPWIKRNCMPGSQTDRPTTSKEYFFLLSKSRRYFYDTEAVRLLLAESSKGRLAQDIANQVGTTRAHGGAKTNGNLKAVGDPESGRLRRESDWFFDSLRAILDDAQILLQDEDGEPLALTVNTSGYKAAHFATFPPRLIAPIVQAGCPERVCPECGNPWVRVTEKGDPVQQHWAPGTQEKINIAQGRHGKTSLMNTGYIRPKITTGFSPACAHNLDPIPGVVLDPFIGSGTTARVAIEHRRNWIGFELNNQYAADLVTQRTNGVQIRLGV